MNTQPQYITDADGEKISVILSIADYEELEDLAAIAERRHELSQPFENALKELGYDLPN